MVRPQVTPPAPQLPAAPHRANALQTHRKHACAFACIGCAYAQFSIQACISQRVCPRATLRVPGADLYCLIMLACLPQPLSLFVSRQRCSLGSLECFLRPWTNCSETARWSLPAPALGGRWLEVTSHEALLASAPATVAPLLAAIRRIGTLPLVALILHTLLRPGAALQQALQAARVEIGWPRIYGDSPRGDREHQEHNEHQQPQPSTATLNTPRGRRRGAARGRDGGLEVGADDRGDTDVGASRLIIGVHVRQGDACARQALARHNRSCDSLSAYLPALAAVRRAYATPSTAVYIYLATDDEGVAAEAYQRNVRSGDDFVWLVRKRGVRRQWPRDRFGEVLQVEGVLATGAIDGYEDALQVRSLASCVRLQALATAPLCCHTA